MPPLHPDEVVVTRWSRRTRDLLGRAQAVEALAAQLATELGPGPLVGAVQSATEDLFRGASLCDAITRELGGDPARERPPELPPLMSTAPVDRAAERTVFLFAAGSTILAEACALAALDAVQPGVASALNTVADDARRHADLGWHLLEALVARSSVDLAEPLTRAAIHAAMVVEAPGPTVDPIIEAGWGLQPAERIANQAQRVVRDQVGPTLERRGLWRAPEV